MLTTSDRSVAVLTESVRRFDRPGCWLVSWMEGRREGGTEGQTERLRLRGETGLPLPERVHDSSLAVIFDGVLYNRAELIKQLGKAADGDAGLICRAYRMWREDVLKHIKGIFSLIICDFEQALLLAVRDPLGVYPLFHARSGSEILLSNSIPALLRHPGVSRELNRAALADHLLDRRPDLEETYQVAVKRVPQGHVLRVSSKGAEAQRYWNPLPLNGPVRWVREDKLDQFDDLLEQAVGRCLAFGRAGIFLSGGLDSVSVASVAADLSRRQQLTMPRALSLIPSQPELSEEAIQRGVARQLGLSQDVLLIDRTVNERGLLQSALELSADWPAPLMNLYLPAFQTLAALGKSRGCQVILTGEGGDEWLSVSPSYAADLLASLDLSGLLRLLGEFVRSYRPSVWDILSNTVWRDGMRPLLGEVVGGPVRRWLPRWYRARRHRLIRRGVPDWIAPDPGLQRTIERREEENQPNIDRRGFYVHDIRQNIESPLLAGAMEEAFENRRRLGVAILHPYWDADLVEFLYRIPPHLLNRGGRSKGLVRWMLARRFPGLGFKRQKKYIGTSLVVLIMLRESRAALEKTSGPSALAKLGIVEPGQVNALIETALREKQPIELFRLFEILNLEAWVRSHL